MALRPSTYTYDDLSKAVMRQFGDESGVQLEVADILRWANAGLIDIVRRNKPLKALSDTNATIGQSQYNFASLNIYEISSIQLDGSALPSLPYNQAENTILESDPKMIQMGKPQFWYTWGDQFWIWPLPDMAYSIRLLYAKLPDKLTGAAGQTLGLSDDYFSTLVDYVLLKVYEMDEDWSAAQAKAQAYENAINQEGEKERDAQDGRYPVITEVN